MPTTPRRAPVTDPPANQPRFLPATSHPGLATSPHASTTLGVPPPPRPTPSQRIPIPSAPPPPRRLWLVVGALAAIAAGIVLAIVLVN
jgi:hypothetical protein